jgi:DNA-binding protein H-NS
MTNNRADISTFESLQSEQHNRTNMSSMSVFNEVTASEVTKLTRELEDTARKALEARRAAWKAYQKAEELVKKANTKEEEALFDNAFAKAKQDASDYAHSSSRSFFS